MVVLFFLMLEIVLLYEAIVFLNANIAVPRASGFSANASVIFANASGTLSIVFSFKLIIISVATETRLCFH